MPDAPSPLYIIDAIGPFFRGYQRRTINWSKIPFEHLKIDGDGQEEQWSGIRSDLARFCERTRDIGANTVSLDDVTHLADHPWYELEIRAKIARWREEFRKCFRVVTEAGLQVYLTMDVFSATAHVRAELAAVRRSVESFLVELLDGFFQDFPEVKGVIIRIGESDGRDVHDVFRSDLYLKQPSQVNSFLRDLLPVFAKHGRTLVFRTWTVGAHRVGDLMWNRNTFKRILKGVEEHPCLVVSMKYGESDFFRFLSLTPNFFGNRVAKIVELQARREYEGCGEYPSFVGWEYERYARELAHAENLRGCMVWCQTGGWVPFRRLAFLDESAVWTELNTFVSFRVFKEHRLVEDAVREFAESRGLPDWQALLELLRLADDVIRELLYVEEFAQQKLFFRRVRIPPILSVYWHNIFISHSVKKVLCHFVTDKESCLRAAEISLEKIGQMKQLAAAAGLPVADIEYMEDTFRLLAMAREYYFTSFSRDIEDRLRAAKKAYKKKYPKSGDRPRYRVKINFSPFRLRYRQLRWAFAIFMRTDRSYRMVDRVVNLYVLSLVYRVIAKRRPQWIPEFAKESAMGVDTIFR